MLSAQDVLTKQFSPTHLRQGYEVDAVDEFLDRVVEVLREYESGSGEPPSLVVADVRSTQFAVTKFREGYAMEEVDAFLDEVERTLSDHERAQRARGSARAPGTRFADSTPREPERTPEHVPEPAWSPDVARSFLPEPSSAPAPAPAPSYAAPPEPERPAGPAPRRAAPPSLVPGSGSAPRSADQAVDLTELVSSLQRARLLSGADGSSTPVVRTPDGQRHVVRSVSTHDGQVVITVS
ncbi:DivIVA domain-containing protein [Sanguibacter suaedae]|uniref:Cell wall synthesis protein Wag31 n=1 Tax=Sanguibacter suaedae TaxID=2795737 RepID=A0A934I9A0_9MICO|nr:DivIVA domain-containing protein [Sanguibacter suaedae]MBI9113580.1 DivIVA domain-containing protein [Sanguibacter suaedae]